MDTDELNSDSKNYEEEVVEFIIKEEITVIDWAVDVFVVFVEI